MLELYTKENWADHLDQMFKLESDKTERVNLKLVGVTGFGRRQGAHREGYSLLFTGPKNPIYQQGIFTVSHDEMGTMAIFLVPVGANGQVTEYEAVFN